MALSLVRRVKPDDNPIFNWIIKNMGKKTLEHILRRTGECKYGEKHFIK